MILHEKLFEELKEFLKQLDNSGELRSRRQLRRYYATFRERFGPDIDLSGLGDLLITCCSRYPTQAFGLRLLAPMNS